MAWLTNWNYRKSVTISNTGSTLLDYQVLITIDTLTLINAGKMRSDCGDIRFTDDDGSTLLSYWIESDCNTASTKIWVKIPSVPASKIIYMYYGNSSATSISNGTNTFVMFLDFENTTEGYSPGTSTTDQKKFGSYSFRLASGSTKTVSTLVSDSYSLIQWFYPTSTSADGTLQFRHNASGYAYLGKGYISGKWSYYEGAWKDTGLAITPNAWVKSEIRFNSGNYDILLNDVLYKTGVSYVSGSLQYIISSASLYIDGQLIRKYASPEPTLSTIGTEETPANITATSMTITPSETPCRVGICTVSVNVTWTNNGGSSGDFIPNITIDGTPYSSPYPLQSLGSGLSDTKTFVISGLAVGARNICPYPN